MDDQEIEVTHDIPALPPKVSNADLPLASEPENLTDFDQVSEFTQHARLRLARKLARSDVDDPAQQSVLLKTLADMDKAVVNKRRLGIEEEAQKTADQQQRDVSELLRGVRASMFQQTVDPNAPPREAPKLSSNHKVELVPGETDQGTASMNYENFMKTIPEHLAPQDAPLAQ